jgi:ASC-1-like (ASCH) protein
LRFFDSTQQEEGETMEGNLNYREVKHYKDGETRDKNGRWAGKVVTVRKEYYQAFEELRQKTGLKKAVFWRMAVQQGVMVLAKLYGIEFAFPDLPEDSQAVEVKPKRKFPAWLFRKR